MISRRGFLKGCAAVGAGCCLHQGVRGQTAATNSGVRSYHASISIDALNDDSELAPTLKDAGVGHVWVACFFHGHWHHTVEDALAWKRRLEDMGMAVHQITVPLGHPTFTETQPDYMPGVPLMPWKGGMRPDGRRYHGVCLHPGATEANVAALKQLKDADPGIVFVDDDFRLAPSPNDIGGCFCEDHKQQFLARHGYGEPEWAALLEAIDNRELAPLVRAWVTDVCDELTASFRAQQEALRPEAELGIMVMYLGSEKAGIRLTDYAGVPMRVGELMFDDASFAPLKGKTNELFSALFHRRFVAPDHAFSETTAWPPDKLSARNMAAKLAVSTLSDVRNTMFMSGNTPFPRTHWATLKPAMRKQAELHQQLAGHAPRGPFKHFWGEHSRWVGDANPYSLWLAAGVPFEVVKEPGADGWVFLSDADARAANPEWRAKGATLIVRPEAGPQATKLQAVEESMDALFAFKHAVLPQLGNVPYVEEDVPVVCAWYPTAQAVLLWNLSEDRKEITLRCGKTRRVAATDGLDTVILTDIRMDKA